MNHSNHDIRKSLSIAALIMTGSVLLSRVIGLFREMILANYAGTSVSMDAYVAAFMIPELLNTLLASGFLSITFIPIFQNHLINNNPDKAWRSFSNLICIGSTVMIIFIAAATFFARDLFLLSQSFLHGTTSTTPTSSLFIEKTVALTRIILPAQLFFYWSSFLMAVQYAQKKFFFPALMPLAYNLAIILGGVLLWKNIGIDGFAWGVLIGSFIGGVICQIIGAKKVGLRFRPVYDIHDPDLWKYIRLSLPFMIGISMSFSNEILFRIFGSIFGQGGISELNYALRIMMILVGVFGLAFASASYPYLSQLAQEKKFTAMNELSSSILIKTGVLLIPLSCSMAALAVPIITLLFERGQFTHASTLQIAPLLSLYLIGAFTFASSSLLTRNYYAIQNTLFPMIVSTIVIIGSLPLYNLGIHFLGIRSVPLVASVTMIAQFVTLLICWNKQSGTLRAIPGLTLTLGKILGAGAVGGAVAALILSLIHIQIEALPAPRWLGTLFMLFAAGVPGLLISAILIDRMKIQNIRDTVRMLFRK